MSDVMFIPGQRWVSQTEAELGLGIVVENTGRYITISFPAAGERRTYAINEAPLTRVMYHQGDAISSADGLSITVDTVIVQHGCLVYSGHDENGEQHQIVELELDSFIHFSKPQDRLFAGQIDKLHDFQLRYQTLTLQHQLQQSPARGLLGPRVELLPHQLYIADTVARRYAPRVLLADEVGLGKTIEAGLIIHQQLTTGRSQRVLIAVPEALQHQWLVEMLRRFNLPFSLLDEERCEALCESGHDNPFEAEQLILCGLPLLTGSDQRLQQVLACDWDLLVVDEAHHLQWQENGASHAYQCIEAIARRARGLLMLTATPEQLGQASHFARLRLLDPDRYYDLQSFLAEEATYRPLNDLVQAISTDELTDEQQQQLIDLVGTEKATAWQADQDNPNSGDELIGELLDRHGTGRVLFRNTRASVKGFPARQLLAHPLQAPTTYVEAAGDASIEERLQPERLLGEDWIGLDPRAAWLQDWLKANRQHKALVICARADTALDLETHLRLRTGARTTAFHEDMSLLERDRAAAYFADDIDGAQVMICSEIGSEGRNFQFAHHLVLFDLPLNPDLLEQRIGRLDRIGQQHTVNIHVPYYECSSQSVLFDWYHQGVNAFERVCPVGQTIFEHASDTLLPLLHAATIAPTALQQLLADTHTFTDKILSELQAGRNQLLERNSCNPQQAQRIIDTIADSESQQQLADYMSQVFDSYGVDQEKHSENASVIHPSDHMQCEHFPGLASEGLTATFDRQQALSREDMQFLTWEHPMVSGCIDMILGSEKGNTSLCTVKLPPLKPGTLMVESIYQLYCPAPAHYQVQRFFSGACVRLLTDNHQRDLSNIISHAHINKLGEKVKLKIGQQLVRQGREPINTIINHSQKLAESQQQPLIDAACEKLLTETRQEIDRLKTLAAVNPNIRQEEIEFLEDQRDEQLAYLKQTQLRLDAVRVIVAT